jgi:hypothetical protein
MNFVKRPNTKGDKIYFYYDLGRKKGQRLTTGVFIYVKPKNQIEKNHNKEASLLLETKRSQYILENQAVGSGFIPSRKFKANFIDYFDEYVKLNQRKGNRHLQNSFKHFKTFVKNDFISPLDIRTPELLVQLVKEQDNILLVKAATPQLTRTNLSVITSDGAVYFFAVHYTTKPNVWLYKMPAQTQASIATMPLRQLAKMRLFPKRSHPLLTCFSGLFNCIYFSKPYRKLFAMKSV